jgi:hypothetical protein
MTLELNEQEHAYLLQIIIQRPLSESLPMYLKVSNQQIGPAQGPVQGSLPLKAVGSEKNS